MSENTIIAQKATSEEVEKASGLPDRVSSDIEAVEAAMARFDERQMEAVNQLVSAGITPLGSAYHNLTLKVGERVLQFLHQIKTAPPDQVIDEAVYTTVGLESLLEKFTEREFETMEKEMKGAISRWDEEWKSGLAELPGTVKRKLDREQLSPKSGDSKLSRKAKKKLRLYGLRSSANIEIPFRDLTEHYYHVSVKPAVHRELGRLSLLNFQFLTTMRKEVGRQLKLLVLSLDSVSPEERIEMVDQRIEDFRARQEAMAAEANAIVDTVKIGIETGVRNSLNATVSMAQKPEVRTLFKKRQKRVNDSALQLLDKRLFSFSETWKFNQSVFHQQLLAELWFGRVSLSVFRVARKTRHRISDEFLKPLSENLTTLQNGLADWRKTLENGKQLEKLEAIVLNDQVFLNADALISHVETTTDSIAQVLPDSSKLIHGDVDLDEMVFTKKLPTITISLNRIADYLIKTNFTESHRKEILEATREFRRLNNRMLNSANLMAYSLEIAKEEKQFEGLNEVVSKSDTEVAAIAENLEETGNKILDHLTEAQKNTLVTLDVTSVVSRADQLKQYVSREPATKPFNQWLSRRMKTLRRWKNRLKVFIVRRRHDVVVARFEKKHEQIVNEGERVQNFIESLRIDPEIDRKLPYYYKQLFSGKHLSNAAGVRIRHQEIDLAKKAIGRIQKGSGGAIAIIGDAMTGKTFLANYIATNLIRGKVYRVAPPPGGAHMESEMHQAIMNACGKELGNINGTLASLEPGSVFIFNDLEQWWLKHAKGKYAIDALIRIIEKFSRRHFFILSSNSFSFRLIAPSSGLENLLAGTIMIAPATQEQIRDIIWLRHSTGGLHLESTGKKVDQLLGGAWDKLMRKFYKRSNGNVGLALHFWLRSITEVEGENIRIEDPGIHTFPEITNPSWKVIIYQLFLHRNLSMARLKLLFEDEDVKWLRQNLNALGRIGLLEETGRETYAINPMCRPYIERWFSELKLIN